jgi:uncharacterized protein YacL
MVLILLRGVFVLLVAAVAALYLLSNQLETQISPPFFTTMLLGAMGLACVIIAGDLLTPRKKLSALSGVILGLIAGLIVAYAISFVVDLVGVMTAPPLPSENPAALTHEEALAAAPAAPAPVALSPPTTRPGTPTAAWIKAERNEAANQRPSDQDQIKLRSGYLNLLQGVKVVIGLISCYLAISLVLQTKGDFRFVIPYVEFAKETRGARPTILDTSVVIDGRILDIVQTNLMQAGLVVPRFVLQELHALADSADKLKRARGRRGLDTVQKLQANPGTEVTLHDADAPGAGVDQKLISLAGELNARIMTNDYNLNKLASLRGLTVINLNDLAAALRPVVLPGEAMRVKIVKPGEGPHQGVGYLDDGTMVVVENARHQIGQEVDLVVTSALQTSAGRMFFGRSQGRGEEPMSGGAGPVSAPPPTAPHEADHGAPGAPGPDAAAAPPPEAIPPAPRDDPPDPRGRSGPSPRNPRRH